MRLTITFLPDEEECCPKCKGTGNRPNDYDICPTCDGECEDDEGNECFTCDGDGTVPVECSYCKGGGTLDDYEKVTEWRRVKNLIINRYGEFTTSIRDYWVTAR